MEPNPNLSPDPDPSLRLRRLSLQGDASAVQELILALEDPMTTSRAAVILMELKATEAVPSLIRLAQNAPDETARANCAYALGELDHPEILPALIALLAEATPGGLRSVVGALGTLGDDQAIPALKPLLAHTDWKTRCDVCGALLELGVADADVETTIQQLGSEPEAANAGYAVENLLQTFTQVSEGLEEEPEVDADEEFEKARRELLDESAEIRTRGVGRLNHTGGEEAVSLLLHALKDSSPRVRSRAALQLGFLKSPEAVPELLRLIQHDPYDHVRLMSAVAFTYRPDPRAFETLVSALDAGDWKLGSTAIQALALLGDARAVPPLLRQLGNSDWTIRLRACEALLELGSSDIRVLEALRQLATEPKAEEHDVSAAESVRDLPMMREFMEPGDPEPQPMPTMAELIQRAQTLVKTASKQHDRS